MNGIIKYWISMCTILLMLCSINNSYALQGKDMPKKKKGEYSVDADNNGTTKSDINEVKKIYIIGIPHIGFELLGAFQIYNKNSERLTEDKVILNWYRDGEIIPGENAHTYVVKEGDYLHEISFGISHAGDNIMMSNPMHIKDGDETNTGIYISTEIGESYSTAACTSNSNCDESSFIYGFGLGYEIGKFAFDVKYNNVTPRYRKFQYVDSIATREMYVGVRYKAWNKDNLAISLGGGFGHWTSLHTGDIVNGTHTYNQSGFSPSLIGDIGYSVTEHIEPYITLRAIKGFSVSKNDEYIGTIGVRFRFGESSNQSKSIRHNTTIVNNHTQNKGVGFLELNFAHDSVEPTNQSIKAISNSFDENFDGCITIIAHASTVGKAKYNEELSEKRAKAIADHIVKYAPKIKDKNIFTKYHLGGTFPVYENDNHNRRAEVFFSQNKSGCEQ